MLTRIDNALIQFHQAAYLWLLDRTGVYLGTLMMANALAGNLHMYSSTAERWGFSSRVALFLLCTGLMGMVSARVWLLQKNGAYLAHNLMALRIQTFRIIRGGFFAFMLPVMLEEIYRLEVFSFLDSLLAVSLQYLLCVQLREREPKSFFKESLSLAGAETSR